MCVRKALGSLSSMLATWDIHIYGDLCACSSYQNSGKKTKTSNGFNVFFIEYVGPNTSNSNSSKCVHIKKEKSTLDSIIWIYFCLIFQSAVCYTVIFINWHVFKW